MNHSLNITCFYLVVCVIDVLNETGDRRLHQYEECELP